MEAFIAKFQGSMYYLLGNPGSTLELFITVALSLIVGTIFLTALGDVLEISNISIFTAAIAMLLGSIITIAVVAVFFDQLPKLLSAKWHKFIPLIGTAAAAVFLVGPIISVLLKGKYLSSLTVWVAVVGGIALIVLGVGTIFDAVGGSKQSASAEKERQATIEQLLVD